VSKSEEREPFGDLAFLDSAEKAYVEGINPAQLDSFLHGLGTIRIGDLKFHGIELYRPQGSRRALPIIETLREVIPAYLLKLIALTGGADGPLGKQFISRPDLEQAEADPERTDWLEEDEYIPVDESGVPVEGLTHKYGERVLATLTYDCAAYCRFCTRGRRVGGELHTLSKEKIDRALDWIEKNSKQHPDDERSINEVILSGGDPLAMEPQAFLYVTKRLGDMQRAGKLDIVRIGTRLPVHNPYGLKAHHYEGLKNLQNPNVMLHINHPCEVTDDFLEVARRLQTECGALLRSQTVLLRAVNDDADVMRRLMKKLVKNQIVPYYVFLNDRNFWNDHFTVSLDEARRIFADYRRELTGLAGTLQVVIDTGHGRGKVPVPIGEFWDYNPDQFRDYDGNVFSTR
jgi:lysine 2,3-aminomutase